MHGAHDFLKAIALVLCVAAGTTVLFQKLRQPVVLGYILAGLIIGPHVPIPLVADPEIVQTLSELGVILLMFSLGLEFSVRKLVQVGPTAGVTAVIQCSVMIWLGFMTGRAFGWTTRESLFTGGIVAISSTTIIAKAFDEQGIKGTLRELVVGILIVEDLVGILLMATLTAIASGPGVSASTLALTSGRLAAFLAGLLIVGLLVIPRAVRAVVRLNRPETTLISSIGICFAIALLAQAFGYSVALGAFIAGSLVAESGEEKQIEHLIVPVRDLFAAIFFVSVGMLIEPALIARHWGAVLALTVVVVIGKIGSVFLGAFLAGNGTRSSVRAGMSLAQIGEFSFIIAGLGLSLGATRDFLYPIAVAVSALTTLTTPWLIRASGPVANLVDRKLPRPLQTFAALYGSWVEDLRTRAPKQGANAKIRRLVRLLVLDAAILAALVIGTSLALRSLSAFVERTLSLAPNPSRVLVVAAAVALSVPFCVGIVRVARRLGLALAAVALPEVDPSRADLAAAPRRALVVTLQLASLLLVGIPLLAVTQPFMPGVPETLVLLVLLSALGVAFWKSATNLQGHVRAGAQTIVEALAAQSQSSAGSPAARLDSLHILLPGLGEPRPVRLTESSYAVGRSLADLNLRGLTGATVLARIRSDGEPGVPSASEQLKAGDVLALAGSHPAVAAAEALLLSGSTDRG